MTTWIDTHPVARKGHRCEMCGRTIKPGEKYMRGAGLDAGTAWTWKECAHCEAFRTVRPDICWDDRYDADSFREYEPTDWLGKVWVMRWQHQWKHGNGDLCVVPK